MPHPMPCIQMTCAGAPGTGRHLNQKNSNMQPIHTRTPKPIAAVVVLSLACGLTACGSNHLTCNDEEAKKEVLEVIHSHIDNVGGFDSRIKPHLGKRYLSNVSTTESDKELGRYSCTATYNYEFKKKTRTVQISYDLKYLEDQKKSQASVSVQRVKTDYFIADAGG